jgi:hypothetical protein
MKPIIIKREDIYAVLLLAVFELWLLWLMMDIPLRAR